MLQRYLLVGIHPAAALPSDVLWVSYDVLGRRVAVLRDGALGTSATHLHLNGCGLRRGTYLIRAVGEWFAATRRSL